MSNLWELEEAKRELQRGNFFLARRYVDKALEAVRCMYCHKGAEDRETRPHFKGWVHLDCAEKYDGRGDYERQHAEEGQ